MTRPITILRAAERRVRAFLSRDPVERRLDEELRFHLDMHVERNLRLGMSPDEARLAARREFGAMERFKDECRDETGLRWLDDLSMDVRYALRALRTSPAFAAVVCLTLALGIGASTAIFSVVDGVMLKPLPYTDPANIVVLFQHDRKNGVERDDVAPGNFLDWQARARGFAEMAAAEPYSLSYTSPDGPEYIQNWNVTEGFFRILGTRAMLGRTLQPDDFVSGRHRVVVLSHALWQRRFGGDPDIVGKSLPIDEASYVVVGVMPPTFDFPRGKEMWTPKVWSDFERTFRGSAYFTVVARLRPGVSEDQAATEMRTIATQLSAEYPRTNAETGVTVAPLADQIVGQARRALLILLGASGFLLLIACANTANLLLARAARREREFALRATLGAGRGRVIRQLLTESTVLAVVGGAAGVLLAMAGVRAIRALGPKSLPRLDEMAVDGRALAFALVTSLLTAVLFGLAPALRAARSDLHDALKAGGRTSSAGLARHRLRRVLVVGEVALAVVLLVGAGLLVRSLGALLSVDRGYRAERVVTAPTFVWNWYRTPEARAAFVRQATDLLAAQPGVAAAAAASSLPLAGAIGADQGTFVIDGQPAPRPGDEPTAHLTVATPGLLDVMGIPLRRGRALAASDDARGAPVVLVNEAMARRYWPGEDPIGKRVTVGFMGRPMSREVVGVIGDFRQTGLETDPRPTIMLPHAQAPTGSMMLTVRADCPPDRPCDARALVPSVKRTIWSINGALPLSDWTTLDELLDTSLRPRRFTLELLGAFALAALLLATVGLYGLLTHATSERTQEIGVRMALGARRGDVLALVMRQGTALAAVGVVAGLAAAAAAVRALRGMLYGITPLDATTFATVPALVLVIALVACLIPALRATRVEPVQALRDG